MYVFSSPINDGMNYSNNGAATISRLPPITGHCPHQHQRYAVVVESATKSYSGNKEPILQNLRMKVPYGAIYGLLGPSGCGKTTLLGCILDRLRLDSGTISLLGHSPGSIEAGVPGPRVGYMPQELALYQEFTIKETLEYFSRLHRMNPNTTSQRIEFLVQFLSLPNSHKLISQLSGGQQRRVSLAAALLHEPALLILDEPTVGMDPLLRTSIWNYLRKVSSSMNATIIITTHYIEEARLADIVGMMRGGRLLEEGDPTDLVMKYSETSLENVFLHLCSNDDAKSNKNSRDNFGFIGDREPNSNHIYQSNGRGIVSSNRAIQGYINGHSRHYPSDVISNKPNDIIRHTPPQAHYQEKSQSSYCSRMSRYICPKRISALLIKNFIKMWRNKGFILFSFILPLLQTALFCVCVGGTFNDLPIAVLNLDEGTSFFNFGEDFLSTLNTSIFQQVNVSSQEEGTSLVQNGEAYAFIYTPMLFTKILINKGNKKLVPDDELRSLGGGNTTFITVALDTIVQPISVTVNLELQKSIKNFTDYLKVLGNQIDESIFEFEPTDGAQSTFRDYMAPGVLITVTYFMAVSLTVMSFIVERKEGLLMRSWVAGVRSIEVMLAHLMSQLILMLGQISVTLMCMFFVFNIPCIGNPVWVILIALIQGFSGMTFGLLLSVLVKDESTAILVALGTFYPLLLLSGIVWPIQGMPYELKIIAQYLPQSLACDGIRAVMYRAADITNYYVWMGHLVPFASVILYLLLAGILLWINK